MLNPNLSILNPGHYETSKMDHLTDHAMRFRLEGRRYALALIHPLSESARQLETALLAPSGHMCKGCFQSRHPQADIPKKIWVPVSSSRPQFQAFAAYRACSSRR